MLRRPGGDHSDCTDLIVDLHEIQRAAGCEATLVAQVADRLAIAGKERRWLIDRYRKAPPQQYRQHILYVAPDRTFSVAALTWEPGAQTCIHNHAGWCAVAVYEGVENEQGYRVCADGGGTYLRETQARALEPGRPVGMVADGCDIHRVGNYSREITISLHVYGVDIERAGNSIRSRFDELVVRA